MQKRPTVDLLLSIEYDSFEQRAKAKTIMTSKDSALFKYRFLEFIENDNNYESYEYPIRIDERTSNFLLGSTAMDPYISPFAKLISPSWYLRKALYWMAMKDILQRI